MTSNLNSGYGGGAGGGLTGFTSDRNTAAPNATINTARIIADTASFFGDIVVSPKGSGSILAHVPDNTNTGGNKRGNYVVDLQQQRLTNTMVASGIRSVIVGGSDNTASGAGSVVVGGEANTASGARAFVGGGYGNQSTMFRSTLAGGDQNIANGDYSFVGSGYGVRCDGLYGCTVGGITNQNYGQASFVGGGEQSYINSSWCVVVGGYYNRINTACQYSTIAGGSNNNIFSTCTYGTISGGVSNNIQGGVSSCVVGGGSGNSVRGNESGIFCGTSNVIENAATQSVIIGGQANTLYAQYSTVLGGLSNKTNTNATYSTAAGYLAQTTGIGERAYASGKFAADYDAMHRRMLYRGTTTTGTTTRDLTADNQSPSASNTMVIPSDATAGFTILVTARRTDVDGESAAWRIQGCLHNNAGTTTLVGTVSVTTLGDTSGGAWTVTVTADDTLDRIKIQANGVTGKTIYWLAHIEALQVLG